MAVRIARLKLTISFTVTNVHVTYEGVDEQGEPTGITDIWNYDLADIFGAQTLDQESEKKFRVIERRVRALLNALDTTHGQEPLEVELDHETLKIEPKLDEVIVIEGGDAVQLEVIWPGTDRRVYLNRRVEELTAGHRRLLGSLLTTFDRMSWEHLRKTHGAETGRPRPRVFISYRKPHERFAEALALRLGEEGMIPWLDKWDILAGDSLPGKIEEGLRSSIAFIPILTADYQSGKWATEELESAIARRIETDFKIIPVLLEPCEKPELIRHLRHVDFTAQDTESFEAKVAEVIDGIYGLTLNPFRG